MVMRLRDDEWWLAGNKRAVLLGIHEDPRTEERHDYDPIFLRDFGLIEPAKDGDVWRITRVPDTPRTFTWRAVDRGWEVVGYVLWCPNTRCPDGVHRWTHASDCPAHDADEACKHGASSCWVWSGAPETDNLSASPSLWVKGTKESDCDFHGYLREGEMVPV